MPHLQFELNFTVPDAEKSAFADRITALFADIMDTGTDHTAVTIRCFGTHDLSFGHATDPEDGIAFVNADIRDGRTSEQKRTLSLGFIAELGERFGVPAANVYVVLTEHPGEHFQLHDRVLPTWAEGDDPLAD